MEYVEVLETKHSGHVRMPLTTWFFATGNDASKLPAPLLSRLARKTAEASPSELDSRDARDIVKLSRLAKEEAGLPRAVEVLRRRG